jgi:hypothetical protein
MAHASIIKKAITMFAANYNKNDAWIDRTLPIWERALENCKDKIVLDAVDEIMFSPSGYGTPKIGDVLEAAKRLGGIQAEKIHKSRNWCDDCRYHEGVRITVARYYRIDQNNKSVSSERVASCTCKDALEVHKGLMTYLERLEKLKADSRIKLHAYLYTYQGKNGFTWEEKDPVGYAEHCKRIDEQRKNGKQIQTFTKYMEK